MFDSIRLSVRAAPHEDCWLQVQAKQRPTTSVNTTHTGCHHEHRLVNVHRAHRTGTHASNHSTTGGAPSERHHVFGRGQKTGRETAIHLRSDDVADHTMLPPNTVRTRSCTHTARTTPPGRGHHRLIDHTATHFAHCQTKGCFGFNTNPALSFMLTPSFRRGTRDCRFGRRWTTAAKKRCDPPNEERLGIRPSRTVRPMPLRTW